MQLEAYSYPVRLEDRVDHALLSGQIYLSERDLLVWLVSKKEFLSEDVLAKIQRVLYGIRHGLIQVTP